MKARRSFQPRLFPTDDLYDPQEGHSLLSERPQAERIARTYHRPVVSYEAKDMGERYDTVYATAHLPADDGQPRTANAGYMQLYTPENSFKYKGDSWDKVREVNALPVDENSREIAMVNVDERFRGKGMAHHLMHQAEASYGNVRHSPLLTVLGRQFATSAPELRKPKENEFIHIHNSTQLEMFPDAR